MPVEERPAVYLSFDDGPHPSATDFALDQLDKYDAKATFFCIGKNVEEHSAVYERIKSKGHVVGNHTHNHMNGWKTNLASYVTNVFRAGKLIDSKAFRPPYGRITLTQVKALPQ